MQEDSLDGIYDTLKDISEISKYGAGISLQTSNIRCEGSKIGFRENSSSSITKMLKVFDSTMRYVNQQNIRNGSMAVYLDIHHPDILDFL
jgi:ribonucleotide reductase alpha subunit